MNLILTPPEPRLKLNLPLPLTTGNKAGYALEATAELGGRVRGLRSEGSGPEI